MTSSELFDQRATAAPPVATPRRLRGRLSSGHLVMIAAALVAGLANFAVLTRSAPGTLAAVAAAPLAAGTPLDQGMVRLVPLEVEDGVRATLLDEEELAAHLGWIVSAPVGEGELLGLAGLRPPTGEGGGRAMSLTLPLSRAADGTLRAGDRVDVISAGGGAAAYVLTDVPVLAVRGLSGGLGGAAELTTTLAVDEEGALRLAAAVDGQGVQLVRATGAPPAQEGAEVRLGADETPRSGGSMAEGDDTDAASGSGSGAEEPEGG